MIRKIPYLHDSVEPCVPGPGDSELHVGEQLVHVLDLLVKVGGLYLLAAVGVPPPVPSDGSVTPFQTVPAQVSRRPRGVVMGLVQPFVRPDVKIVRSGPSNKLYILL